MSIRTKFAFVACIVTVFFGWGVSASTLEAAQEPEELTIDTNESGVIYLGPVQDDRSFEQRILDHQASGAIDVYNIWPSTKKPQLKSDLTINNMTYTIFYSDSVIYLAQLIFNYASSIQLEINYKLSVAGSYTARTTHNINGSGYHVIYDQINTRDLRTGYYKLVSSYRVIGGGSGTGKESCYFDVMP